MQSTIQIIMKTLNSKKKKERFETILEPLQAILQIGFLSYFPIGTKIAIQNNILILQPPNYAQSVQRWYNNDTKEDLYYLFSIFTRFKKFYNHLVTSKIKIDNELYNLLVELAKTGLNNLIRTYTTTEKTHLLSMLQLYKNMLENPESASLLISKESQDMSETKNIDDIFIRIVDLYPKELLHIIYNTLHLLKNDELHYLSYIDGLNKIMEPINEKIKKWIDENIIF